MVLSLCAVPSAMLAAEKSPATKEIPAEVKTMLNRLEEIKEMDKSSLKSQKKELRKVREIKSELKRSGQGVYFSVGDNNHYS
jgi:nitric oxide reductase activation protein